MITALHHFAFTIAEVDRSVDFYTQVFSRPPEWIREFGDPYTSIQHGYQATHLRAALFRFPNDEVSVEFVQYLNPIGATVNMETMNPGTAHLGLSTPDLDDEYVRLVRIGAHPRSSEPVEITSGPNAGRRVALFGDHDGITLEILEFRG